MSKTIETCSCGKNTAEQACSECRETESQQYWCETCERIVAHKRCPLCGLKARKIQPDTLR